MKLLELTFSSLENRVSKLEDFRIKVYERILIEKEDIGMKIVKKQIMKRKKKEEEVMVEA